MRVPGPDVIIECTGVASLVLDAMSHVGIGGVVCLTGVSSGGHTITVDEGALNRSMVLENVAVVGSVNANRRHYEAAAVALAKADPAWLARLVNRRVPLAQWQEAVQRGPGRRQGHHHGQPRVSGRISGLHHHAHPHAARR